jgi:hypothetical protein
MNSSTLEQIILFFVFIATILPCAIYPGILMAGIMMLAAPVRENTPWILTILIKTVVYMSLLYPFVIGACWSGGVTRNGAYMSLTYLATCAVLVAIWYFSTMNRND